LLTKFCSNLCFII